MVTAVTSTLICVALCNHSHAELVYRETRLYTYAVNIGSRDRGNFLRSQLEVEGKDATTPSSSSSSDAFAKIKDYVSDVIFPRAVASLKLACRSRKVNNAESTGEKEESRVCFPDRRVPCATFAVPRTILLRYSRMQTCRPRRS